MNTRLYISKHVIAILLTGFSFVNQLIAQVNFPPCSAYDTIGRDTIRAVNSYSNSLYAGIDNPIEINKTNLPYTKYFIECSKGIVLDDYPYLIVIPAKPGTVVIRYYQYERGDTLLAFSKTFNVLKVPQPFIALEKTNLSSFQFLTKDQLKKNKRFEVLISEDFVNDKNWFTIKEITIGYPKGKLYVVKSCLGPELTDNIVKGILELISGKEVSFSFTIKGTGDIYKRIPPIRVKVY